MEHLYQIAQISGLKDALYAHREKLKHLQVIFDQVPIPQEPRFSTTLNELKEWASTLTNAETVSVRFPGKGLIKKV